MDGILIVDKPQGMTSHDVVDFVRRKFNIKKVGHAGTLDPMATGVLVILMGDATKLSGAFIKDDKEYLGQLTLGAVSDTGDAWGTIRRSSLVARRSIDGGVWPNSSSTGRLGLTPLLNEPRAASHERQDIEAAFKKFLGPIEQVPPAYSAVKHKGKKLYQYARKGIVVKMEPRKVTIHKLDILKVDIPRVDFVVGCSKGTYVRQLAVDIGEGLGVGAYLSALRRTRSGKFSIDSAVSLEEIKRFGLEDLEKRLIICTAD